LGMSKGSDVVADFDHDSYPFCPSTHPFHC
jgi:hypothetical protein